ncbi:MAG: inorganic diphosphatase [Candidatus Acidiferrales bacterium]
MEHARAMGMMTMIDSRAEDHKIIAIAAGDPEFDHYWEVSELPPHKLAMVRRFFWTTRNSRGRPCGARREGPNPIDPSTPSLTYTQSSPTLTS